MPAAAPVPLPSRTTVPLVALALALCGCGPDGPGPSLGWTSGLEVATDVPDAGDEVGTLDGTPVEGPESSAPGSVLRTVGGGEADGLEAALHTATGDLWTAGWTRSEGQGGSDGWLLRWNPAGWPVERLTWGGPEDDALRALAPVGDGGVLAAGVTSSAGHVDQAWLLRVAPTGQTLWSRVLGGAGVDGGMALATDPGGHLLVTTTRQLGGGIPMQRNAWVLRLTATGEVAWTRVFWGTDDVDPWAVLAARTPQGEPDGWLVVGGSHAGAAGHDDAWLLRIDPAGAVRWSRAWGDKYEDRLQAAVQLEDGGFFAVGSTRNFGAQKQDLLALRLTPGGDLMWATRHGTSADDQGRAVWRDGEDVAVLVHTVGGAAGEGHLLWLRLDLEGEALDPARLGDPATTCDPRAVVADAKGGFTAVGRYAGPDTSDTDALVLQVRDLASPGCAVDAYAKGSFKSKSISADARPLELFVSAPAPDAPAPFDATRGAWPVPEAADRCAP